MIETNQDDLKGQRSNITDLTLRKHFLFVLNLITTNKICFFWYYYSGIGFRCNKIKLFSSHPVNVHLDSKRYIDHIWI